MPNSCNQPNENQSCGHSQKFAKIHIGYKGYQILVHKVLVPPFIAREQKIIHLTNVSLVRGVLNSISHQIHPPRGARVDQVAPMHGEERAHQHVQPQGHKQPHHHTHCGIAAWREEYAWGIRSPAEARLPSGPHPDVLLIWRTCSGLCNTDHG